MVYILIALLAGISFVPLLTPQIDYWHAQGLWTQLCIMVMFSWSFFEKPKRSIEISSKPLGLIHLYIGVYLSIICFKLLIHGKYDTIHFFPYFNFLCLLILYKIIVEYIKREQIVQILNILRYVLITTLLVCCLQFFGLAQFFKLLFPEDPHISNPVIGFIGNGTHLSGFLAQCSPLFFMKNSRENNLAIVLLILILCFSGMSISDPAISGFVILLIVWIYFFKKDKPILIGTIILLPMFGYLVHDKLPQNFFSFSGRVGIWKQFWELFKQMPITGFGVGAVNSIYEQFPQLKLRHLHNEYFHYLFEMGWIGLILIIYLIKNFLEVRANDKVELTLKAIVIGFLVSCFFNWPSHLWLPSTFAMFSFASLYAIKNEE